MNSSARLLVQIGAQPERSYPIERDITILGREAINDMVINDAEVSRRHTRIVREADGYLIEDLGSTNGTFVNGKRVTVPTLLYHGDVIDMGKSAHLIFKLDQPYEQMTKPIQMEQPEPPQPAANAPSVPVEMPPESAVAVESSPYAPYYAQHEEADAIAVQKPELPRYEEVYEEYEEADSAEFYRPPASAINPSSEDEAYSEPEEGKAWQRYFMTCGCLTLLIAILIITTLLILDQVAWEFLYCGPLQGFWQKILAPILSRTGGVWACP